MQKRLLIIAGSVVFGMSLLAHLPAQLVLPKNAGKFQFLGIGGSVWRGEVKQILFSGKPLPVRDLNWSVNPAALFSGTLNADFYEQQLPVNRGNMGFNLLSRQVELEDLHWQLAVESLDPWIRLRGVRIRGNLALDVQTVVLPPNAMLPSQLQGRLEWQNAVLQSGSEYWPIGSPAVRLSAENDTWAGTVTNSQPMLPGDGSFQCTLKNCRVELSVQPTPDAPQAVLNALLLLGLQRNGDEFSGQITLPPE